MSKPIDLFSVGILPFKVPKIAIDIVEASEIACFILLSFIGLY